MRDGPARPEFSLEAAVGCPPAYEVASSKGHAALLAQQLRNAATLVAGIDRALRKTGVDPAGPLPESLFCKFPELDAVYRGLKASVPDARRALSYHNELHRALGKGARYPAATKTNLIHTKGAHIAAEGAPEVGLDVVACNNVY